jgi:hypothetical protein
MEVAKRARMASNLCAIFRIMYPCCRRRYSLVTLRLSFVDVDRRTCPQLKAATEGSYSTFFYLLYKNISIPESSDLKPIFSYTGLPSSVALSQTLFIFNFFKYVIISFTIDVPIPFFLWYTYLKYSLHDLLNLN